jgi:hypothetical protein
MAIELDQPVGTEPSSSMVMAQTQVWVRCCPVCESLMMKDEPLESWRCRGCGWQ